MALRATGAAGLQALRQLLGDDIVTAPAFLGSRRHDATISNLTRDDVVTVLYRLPEAFRLLGHRILHDQSGNVTAIVGCEYDDAGDCGEYLPLPPSSVRGGRLQAWVPGHSLSDVLPPELPASVVDKLLAGRSREPQPRSVIAQWLASDFLKVDPVCYSEANKAAFTLAAMMYICGKGKTGNGNCYADPNKIARLLGLEARAVAVHRQKLRQYGWLQQLPRSSRHKVDHFTEKTAAAFKNARRWVRVPLCELGPGKPPTAGLMVLGALLSRGYCVATEGEEDWQRNRDGTFVPVVPSIAKLVERCGASREVTSKAVKELVESGILVEGVDDRREPTGFQPKALRFAWWPGMAARAERRTKDRKSRPSRTKTTATPASSGFWNNPELCELWRP